MVPVFALAVSGFACRYCAGRISALVFGSHVGPHNLGRITWLSEYYTEPPILIPVLAMTQPQASAVHVREHADGTEDNGRSLK